MIYCILFTALIYHSRAVFDRTCSNTDTGMATCNEFVNGKVIEGVFQTTVTAVCQEKICTVTCFEDILTGTCASASRQFDLDPDAYLQCDDTLKICLRPPAPATTDTSTDTTDSGNSGTTGSGGNTWCRPDNVERCICSSASPDCSELKDALGTTFPADIRCDGDKCTATCSATDTDPCGAFNAAIVSTTEYICSSIGFCRPRPTDPVTTGSTITTKDTSTDTTDSGNSGTTGGGSNSDTTQPATTKRDTGTGTTGGGSNSDTTRPATVTTKDTSTDTTDSGNSGTTKDDSSVTTAGGSNSDTTPPATTKDTATGTGTTGGGSNSDTTRPETTKRDTGTGTTRDTGTGTTGGGSNSDTTRPETTKRDTGTGTTGGGSNSDTTRPATATTKDTSTDTTDSGTSDTTRPATTRDTGTGNSDTTRPANTKDTSTDTTDSGNSGATTRDSSSATTTKRDTGTGTTRDSSTVTTRDTSSGTTRDDSTVTTRSGGGSDTTAPATTNIVTRLTGTTDTRNTVDTKTTDRDTKTTDSDTRTTGSGDTKTTGSDTRTTGTDDTKTTGSDTRTTDRDTKTTGSDTRTTGSDTKTTGSDTRTTGSDTKTTGSGDTRTTGTDDTKTTGSGDTRTTGSSTDATAESTSSDCNERGFPFEEDCTDDPGDGATECALKVEIELDVCDLKRTIWRALNVKSVIGQTVFDTLADLRSASMVCPIGYFYVSALQGSLRSGTVAGDIGDATGCDRTCATDLPYSLSAAVALRCSNCNELQTLRDKMVERIADIKEKFKDKCLSNSQTTDTECAKGFRDVSVNRVAVALIQDGKVRDFVDFDINEAVAKQWWIGIMAMFSVFMLF